MTERTPDPITAWLQASTDAWSKGLALQRSMLGLPPLADHTPDPTALWTLWEQLATAYQRDLEDLPGKMAPKNAAVLARIGTELAMGTPSPQALRYLQRFADSLRIKAQHGAEVYAEPDSQPVAPTPRELVHRAGSMRLYRYGTEHTPGRPPILLVYSIINRSWILDFLPGMSVVAHLLDQGLDVYLAEWEPAEPGCTDTLDDMIDPGLHSAVTRVGELSGHARPVMLGQCIGGTLALLYAARHPDALSGLITLTTPVTSTGSSVLELWLDPQLLPIDDLVATTGHIPGKALRASIVAIKPYLEVLKAKSYYENLHDDEVMAYFHAVDQWANDNPDLSGAVFAKFLREVYGDDRLLRGETLIHGEPVDLSAITCPLLNLAAAEDWIVPPQGAARIIDAVGSTDTHHELLPGSHVGIVLDPRARHAWGLITDFVHTHAGKTP